jgi:epoxyqueuosine reductase QueG
MSRTRETARRRSKAAKKPEQRGKPAAAKKPRNLAALIPADKDRIKRLEEENRRLQGEITRLRIQYNDEMNERIELDRETETYINSLKDAIAARPVPPRNGRTIGDNSLDPEKDDFQTLEESRQYLLEQNHRLKEELRNAKGSSSGEVQRLTLELAEVRSQLDRVRHVLT